MNETSRLAQIKQLYFNATKSTIQRDLAKAIDLLKQMSDDDERQKAAVYMDGLSQMRSEWAASKNKR
jgi:hypothetical protein